jgi:hypothetical protein
VAKHLILPVVSSWTLKLNRTLCKSYHFHILEEKGNSRKPLYCW